MTSIDAISVTDPTELGLDEAAWGAFVTRARAEVDAGLLPSCQFAFARDGRVISLTLGDAAPDSRYVIFSATKPVVAAAVWRLIGSGAIDVSRRVAEYIPEFGTNGKDVITVEQVMLHTSGFPHAPFVPLQWDDRDARLARFGEWRCNWEPGSRFEYHPTSAHWVLAELIERVSGTRLPGVRAHGDPRSHRVDEVAHRRAASPSRATSTSSSTPASPRRATS